MLAYIIRRVGQSALVLLIVGLVAFSMFRFVGDPIDNMLGQERTAEDIDRLRAQLGLPQLPAGSDAPVITDVASVKGCLRDAAIKSLGVMAPRLVLAHPIAGSERSGVEASSANLFVDHRVILTPLDENDADALAAAVSSLIAPDHAAAMAHAGWDVVSQGADLTDKVTELVQDALDRVSVGT
mgnify:CR=1 FL=1